MDFILNGKAHGSVASKLLNSDFDPRILRPYKFEQRGQSYITQNLGGEERAIATNADATLLYDEWKIFDTAVMMAARNRLRFVRDIRDAGLVYTIPNGLASSVFLHQKINDGGSVQLSMDGIRRGDNDRPVADLDGLPLPLLHGDFQMSARELAMSRKGAMKLDTTMAEMVTRRLAERAEEMAIGTAAVYQFAGYSIYGAVNHPDVNLKTITAPTAAGWTPAQTVTEVMEMKKQSQDDRNYGPWRLYVGNQWDVYLDDDYSAAKGDNTLRERLLKIQGIQSVTTLDYLATSNFPMLLVQMQGDTIREVIGMDFTTVSWEGEGGMSLNFKIMGILVPQIRSDYYNRIGIVYATSA